MPELSPRRLELLDSATRVLATQGARGLTHRAVDRDAGLPEGTCSAYWRTRHALTRALAEHAISLLSRDVAGLASRVADRPDPEARVRLVLAMFTRWLKEPTVLLARLELTLMSMRDDDLGPILSAGREEMVRVVAEALGRAGSADVDQAETLVAALDGVLLGALLLPARSRTAYLRRSLHRVVDGLAAGTPGDPL